MNIDFGRLITAMVTPFNADLQVNYEKTTELVNHLLDTGSDSILVNGTTGESPTLSCDEKIQMFKTVKAALGNRGKMLAGTGCNDTAKTIEFTKAAEQNGADGVLVVAPYYNKPPQEGIYRHFKAIAESTSLPLFIYNIPGRTGINMSVDTICRLAEIPNIVAVKESTGNVLQSAELRARLGDSFDVYSGDDSLTLPIMSVGGKGVISVASHVVGKQMKEMINAFVGGDTAKAAAINSKLSEIYYTLFITSNPIMVKAACNLLGHEVGGLRLPLIDADEKELSVLRRVLADLQ